MNESLNTLFCERPLDDLLQDNHRQVIQAVESIPEQQFLCAIEQEIVEHVYSRFEIPPLELYEDAKEMEREEIGVDVSRDRERFFMNERRGPFYVTGIRITVSIPFVGPTELWRCRPNTFSSNPPYARIRLGRDRESGFIDIVVEAPLDTAGDGSVFNAQIAQVIGDIKWYLEQICGQVSSHNQSLRSAIKNAIQNRRNKLGKFAEIAKAINIPLRHKPGAPDVSQLLIKQRIIRPLPSKSGHLPEPTIDNQEYENILKIIRHEGRTFETTPSTYAVHDEEELRDIMLAHLNGHYEGDASGETFRRHGKTDIRIEDRTRAAFIAECKVWRGPKELAEAIDQLLAYMTWRDCKAALIIFNKDVSGFTGIQRKVPEVLSKHTNHLSSNNVNEKGEWRFKFRSAEDPERNVLVHVFLFNLFVAKGNRRNDQ